MWNILQGRAVWRKCQEQGVEGGGQERREEKRRGGGRGMQAINMKKVAA